MTFIPQLESADLVDRYTLHVRFADGSEGNVNLEGELWGDVFEPLKDPALFSQYRLDRELNTVVWPTGADLSPEFLYEQATGARPNGHRRSA